MTRLSRHRRSIAACGVVGVVLILAGCSGEEFDSVRWRAAGNGCSDGNPRLVMAEDLVQDVLRAGMAHDAHSLLAAEDEVDAGENERQLAISETSGSVFQDGAVDGDDL